MAGLDRDIQNALDLIGPGIIQVRYIPSVDSYLFGYLGIERHDVQIRLLDDQHMMALSDADG